MTRQVILVFYGDARWETAEGHSEPHEAPPTMTIPLIVLAVLAAVGGILNLPFGDLAALGNFLLPVIHISEHELLATGAQQVMLAALSTLAALAGIAIARSIWWRSIDHPEAEPVILQRAWGVDAAVSALVGGPGREFADFTAYTVDKEVVDGAYNGVAVLVRRGGEQLRKVQTGFVRNYALGVAAGTVALFAYVIWRAVG
jgi:NADH-quinone oxidoreductase subunit L